jgi:hypothetical protein
MDETPLPPQAVRRANALPGDSSTGTVTLPPIVGKWTLNSGSRTITAETIFDYMDGAGELYLGYRFRQLEVREYASKDEDAILVELYWMDSSDDAFGLISGDWGGDPVSQPGPARLGAGTGTWPQALYGAGLLRIWSDNLYARILAQSETDASRQAVLAIGKAIVAGRQSPAPPFLVRTLPQQVEPSFTLEASRLCYFRSHLVLNSAYFLSPSNILDLDPTSEAVTATYVSGAKGPKRTAVRLVAIRYRTADAARRALEHFRRIYLPEKGGNEIAPAGARGILRIEDGWTGFNLSESSLVLVFESPTSEIANVFLTRLMASIGKMEDTHAK